MTVNVKQLMLDSANEPERALVDEDVSNIALILYTSGSTGTPKGKISLIGSHSFSRIIFFELNFPYFTSLELRFQGYFFIEII